VNNYFEIKIYLIYTYKINTRRARFCSSLLFQFYFVKIDLPTGFRKALEFEEHSAHFEQPHNSKEDAKRRERVECVKVNLTFAAVVLTCLDIIDLQNKIS
jgi:hypothetical protein